MRRATVCAAMLLIVMAACGWRAEAEEEVRDGCRQLVDAPFGTAGWHRAWDQVSDTFHEAADLDDRWNTVALAHDRLRNLPADAPADELLAELETWKEAVAAECEKVNVNVTL